MRRVFGALILVGAALLLRAGDLYPPAESAGENAFEQLPAVRSTPAARRPHTVRKRTGSVPKSYVTDPLNFLSTAPVDSLIMLPGVGPVIAERLASARSGKRLFTEWEDLLTIKGIGPKKLHRLRTLASEKN